jgi:Protein of unknown function (DUF1236)
MRNIFLVSVSVVGLAAGAAVAAAQSTEPSQRQEPTRPGMVQDQPGSTTGMAPARGFTTQQRSTIHGAILKEHVTPANNVDFSLNVGIVVPRTIVIHPLPPQIVDVEPQWDGYMFFLAGNDLIVVEPDTLRIVAVLPA